MTGIAQTVKVIVSNGSFSWSDLSICDHVYASVNVLLFLYVFWFVLLGSSNALFMCVCDCVRFCVCFCVCLCVCVCCVFVCVRCVYWVDFGPVLGQLGPFLAVSGRFGSFWVGSVSVWVSLSRF